jgi:hypothetical protein
MVPPEGYSVKERIKDSSGEKEEDDLIYALGFWAEMSDGVFPDTINDLADSDRLKSMIIEKYDKDDDPEREWDAASNEAQKVLMGAFFAQKKKAEGSWGYTGQGIVADQAEAVICWWFDDDEQCYKAVFGDLRIETVSKDQLPLQP